MSSLIPHDYRYKISSPTPVDKEPLYIYRFIQNKKNIPKDVNNHIGAGEENRTLTVSLEG